jgi:hypothetical protein
MSSDGSARVLGGIPGGSTPLGCAWCGRTADTSVQCRYTTPVIDSINRESRRAADSSRARVREVTVDGMILASGELGVSPGWRRGGGR